MILYKDGRFTDIPIAPELLSDAFRPKMLKLFNNSKMSFINRLKIFSMTLAEESERSHIVKQNTHEKSREQAMFWQIFE